MLGNVMMQAGLAEERHAKAKRKRVEFKIAFDLPEGCSFQEAKECLIAQIMAMGGDLRPPFAYHENDTGHPMFGFNYEEQNTSVTQIRKKKS